MEIIEPLCIGCVQSCMGIWKYSNVIGEFKVGSRAMKNLLKMPLEIGGACLFVKVSRFGFQFMKLIMEGWDLHNEFS